MSHLFKAKRTDNGEWIIGYYFHTEAMADGHKDYIIPSGSNFCTNYGVEGGYVTHEKFIEIDKDTLCQYGKSKTNADHIRAMSDEELYNLIEKIKMCGGLLRTETTSSECRGCKDGFCCNVLHWLKSEVEG